VQVTVNLLIMGGNSEDMDQLVHAVRSHRRRVKVVKFPTVDFTNTENPISHQTLLAETVQKLSLARKQALLLLLPW